MIKHDAQEKEQKETKPKTKKRKIILDDVNDLLQSLEMTKKLISEKRINLQLEVDERKTRNKYRDTILSMYDIDQINKNRQKPALENIETLSILERGIKMTDMSLFSKYNYNYDYNQIQIKIQEAIVLITQHETCRTIDGQDHHVW